MTQKQTGTQKRTGRRMVRPSTDEERKRYRAMLKEEKAEAEANKAFGRELLAERRELSAIVTELKALREQLEITLTELAERTGMTVGNLSRLENMKGPNPTIETQRFVATPRPSAIASRSRWWRKDKMKLAVFYVGNASYKPQQRVLFLSAA